MPGLSKGKISELLRAFTKEIRREQMPFPPKVAEIAAEEADDLVSHPAGCNCVAHLRLRKKAVR